MSFWLHRQLGCERSNDPFGGSKNVTMGRRVLLGVLAYGLWLASAALTLVAALYMRLFLLIDLPIVTLRANRYTQRAADRFGTVLLGLAWLIFVVATEPYF